MTLKLRNLQRVDFKIETNRGIEIQGLRPPAPGEETLGLDEVLVVNGSRDVELEIHADKIVVRVI